MNSEAQDRPAPALPGCIEPLQWHQLPELPTVFPPRD